MRIYRESRCEDPLASVDSTRAYSVSVDAKHTKLSEVSLLSRRVEPAEQRNRQVIRLVNGESNLEIITEVPSWRIGRDQGANLIGFRWSRTVQPRLVMTTGAWLGSSGHLDGK
ncbi:hypothetical protein N7539_008294 [Penicillium diatomitis]|uniref:Uncharacterized protein n=1 Tax=Penicillium diatomitis TaxID=2819901 RepID=A0A9X0BNC5_9EURO|nr:uncharacterized protein N7539_008294 [Penicillium diatomitis]KAJ5475228.1 hypothetical protein N7539_008294 [Penicillium diatomitis]